MNMQDFQILLRAANTGSVHSLDASVRSQLPDHAQVLLDASPLEFDEGSLFGFLRSLDSGFQVDEPEVELLEPTVSEQEVTPVTLEQQLSYARKLLAEIEYRLQNSDD